MNPQSRGSVKLKSANPAENPLIELPYLQHNYDRYVLIHAVRKAMALVKTPSYEKYYKSRIFGPKSPSDEDIWVSNCLSFPLLSNPICSVG